MKTFNNFNLTNYNSYKIKAVCKRAFFPETVDDIIKIYNQNSDVEKIIIGNGNNIILSKKYFKKDFIIFNGNLNKIKVNNNRNTIVAEAGATILELSNVALNNQLSGLEMFHDIPSSIGGAVVMNAGTKEGEIKDILIKVMYLDLSVMLIKEIAKEDISFEYRNSFFQKHSDKIVLEALFKLEKGNSEEIKNKMEENIQTRWAKQPREYPNCGSVFKRPKGYYVGSIIEELGLKGYSVGGAKVSEKHAGFIINYNNAAGKDILDLIKIIKTKVKNTYGIELELEQKII